MKTLALRVARAQRLGIAGVVATLACACTSVATHEATREFFFDDFSYRDAVAVQRAGWRARDKPGHPGVAGATWSADRISLVDDPDWPGNRLLRLTARTDGSVAGTGHTQLCHARKYLEGTYAARVRFADRPIEGPDGDVIVQTFYAVGPLRFDFDPDYSEVDWEYLPNGGWGDPRTRLYGVSWQTARIEPWWAFNQPFQLFHELGGWHVLLMQVAAGKVRFFVDGTFLGEAGGRNYPTVAMSLNFSLWFSPGGLLPEIQVQRVYQQDIDWVVHFKDKVLSPAEVEATVRALRERGTTFVDSVPEREPRLESMCDF